MRVLVLGGTQFIGAAAVRALASRGHEVTCFHRGPLATRPASAPPPPALPASVQHVHGDRGELALHQDALAATRPEALLDMRCMTAQDAEATLALVRAAACKRVVVASSCDVHRAFGVVLGREQGLEPLPIREDSPVRERRYLYRADPPRAQDDPERWKDQYEKLDVEDRLRAAPELGATIVRFPMVHGPHDPRRRVRAYLRRMRPDRRALALPASAADWRPCRCHVDDAGAVLVRALETPRAAGRTYDVADPPITERAFVEAIARAAGWPGEVRVVPDERLPEPLRAGGMNLAQHLDVDASRARAELAWRPQTSLDEGLASAVAWERAAPQPPLTDEERAADEADAALG